MQKILYFFTIFFISSCGGGGGSQEISQNSQPIITNNIFTYDVLENQNLAFTIEASDPDSDSISFQISGGADQKLFFVSNSGQVSFLSSPDFENPSDDNLDNSYEISIRAFDGSLYSASYNFTVNVTNDVSDDGDDNSSATCSEQSESTSYCTISWDNLEREFYVVFPEEF